MYLCGEGNTQKKAPTSWTGYPDPAINHLVKNPNDSSIDPIRWDVSTSGRSPCEALTSDLMKGHFGDGTEKNQFSKWN